LVSRVRLPIETHYARPNLQTLGIVFTNGTEPSYTGRVDVLNSYFDFQDDMRVYFRE
jgi:hypothetical protein